MENIIRCSRCVMDNVSDNYIQFDQNGVCNYCTEALENISMVYHPSPEDAYLLENLMLQVKNAGKDKRYDCIMGLSGGLDSSYLALLGVKWGLRVLAVHIDDGFDSELTKNNLEKLVAFTGYDYEVIKPDSTQFVALTKAYMLAGVPNLAVPQDNILFAYIYKKMKEYGIKYFLSGGNFALESILQKGNTHSAYDLVNLKAIHKKYGEEPIDKLEFISYLKREFNNHFLGIKTIRPLNYIEYNRQEALEELAKSFGFEYYGRKHLENTLTAFIQLYWFPKKFNVDKRTSHLSSMIISKQITREQALEELKKPLWHDFSMDQCLYEIKNRLQITDEEFVAIMNNATVSHNSFAIQDDQLIYKIVRFLKSILFRKRQ